jgi:hypothetical protein
MSKKLKLDPFHQHEMLDRLHIVAAMMSTHLLQHPAAKVRKDVKQNIEQAIQSIWTAYQLTGDTITKDDE